MVAGTQSGAGKTTITLGLMAAMLQKGLKVAPFKVGPDYIDPGYHRIVSGRVSRNLDGWMLNRKTNERIFATHSSGADIAVVEGVMGLYDGFSGQSEAGSTAQMAKWLKIPVLLVVDAHSMARSTAALVQGFENFDEDVPFAGVLFNRLGSDAHLEFVRAAVKGNVRMPCVGGIGQNEQMMLPERHLGLVTPEDNPLSQEWIGRAAAMLDGAMDVSAFVERLPTITVSIPPQSEPYTKTAEKIRIGWASDQAFCFYYADNLDLLEQYGAELVPFSPIADGKLPPELDGLYLGGGYPELNAAALSDNSGLRKQIRISSQNGMPIYGECGGFMYLCSAIEDPPAGVYPMTGCFPMTTRMTPKLRRLGYREITLRQASPIGGCGLTARGHEFHYSEMVSSHDWDGATKSPIKTIYHVTDREGGQRTSQGYLYNRTLGSYVHLHFASRPEIAAAFIENCRQYRLERKTFV